jgi:hypothetical protein
MNRDDSKGFHILIGYEATGMELPSTVLFLPDIAMTA